MEDKKILSPHSLMLENRQGGRITGVKDVKSFDEKEISLVTEAGILLVKGEELHVTRLDLEKQEVDIGGKVDSLLYSQGTTKAKGGEGVLKRLFQ